MGLLAAVILVALASAADAAPADCRLLLDALDNADRQPRVAQYDIETHDQPLTGDPFLVRIGTVVWVNAERTETDGTNPILRALARTVADGTARCEPAGTGTFRGAAVVKIRFDNPMAPARYNPTTMWIDRRRGLPVYHEVNGLGPGGYAWVFGDSVKDPAARQ
jgi:hypothetical protein